MVVRTGSSVTSRHAMRVLNRVVVLILPRINSSRPDSTEGAGVSDSVRDSTEAVGASDFIRDSTEAAGVSD